MQSLDGSRRRPGAAGQRIRTLGKKSHEGGKDRTWSERGRDLGEETGRHGANAAGSRHLHSSPAVCGPGVSDTLEMNAPLSGRGHCGPDRVRAALSCGLAPGGSPGPARQCCPLLRPAQRLRHRSCGFLKSQGVSLPERSAAQSGTECFWGRSLGVVETKRRA